MQNKEEHNLEYYQLLKDENIIEQILNVCYQKNIQSILVEGGSKLLQSFIDAALWDEARIITNTNLHIETSLNAPQLHASKLHYSENIFTDRIDYFQPQLSSL